MADEPASSPAPAGETPTQKAARLRREKRAAKIAAEGDARLEKITGVAGRKAPEIDGAPKKEAPKNAPSTPSKQPSIQHEDPEEVDISQHYYTPEATQRIPTGPSPFAQGPGASVDSQTAGDDPMMKMLQSLMGGQDPNAPPDQQPDLPPGMAQMMSMLTGQAPPGEQVAETRTSTAYLWRIVHFVFALGLGGYIALSSTFNGSALARERSAHPSVVGGTDISQSGGGLGKNLFLLFATFEVVLQSSRYFVEKGQLPTSGWLATIGGFLPPPYNNYVRMIGRYSVIYTTIVADAMTVIFLLGFLAWWKGAVEA